MGKEQATDVWDELLAAAEEALPFARNGICSGPARGTIIRSDAAVTRLRAAIAAARAAQGEETAGEWRALETDRLCEYCGAVGRRKVRTTPAGEEYCCLACRRQWREDGTPPDTRT